MLVLAGIAAPALAAIEREDIVLLDADGRHYTRYQTLRSDAGPQSLVLAPGETLTNALFIVPSNYQQTWQADGGTRLRFEDGSYAVMASGRFDKRIHRADNGDHVFASRPARTGESGDSTTQTPKPDFASYAYSWVVPANIEVIEYRANRSGQWRQQNNTLSWHGQYVNDIAFTIRYRVTGDTATASYTHDSGLPQQPGPPARDQRTPEFELKTSPATTIAIEGRAPAADPAAPAGKQTPPRSLSLDSVVMLTDNGRPQVTARGQNILGRLARTLAVNAAERIRVTGPAVDDSRDVGGSAAQAARVADYLDKNGVDSNRVDIEPGRVEADGSGDRIRITVTPGNALGNYSSEN